MDDSPLTQIELFLFIEPPSFLPANRRQRGCCFVLKLTCGTFSGIGLCRIAAGRAPGMDLIKWGSFLKAIRRRTTAEALKILQLEGRQWESDQLALVASALQDLKAAHQKALKLAAGAENPTFRLKPNPPTDEQLFRESTAYFSVL